MVVSEVVFGHGHLWGPEGFMFKTLRINNVTLVLTDCRYSTWWSRLVEVISPTYSAANRPTIQFCFLTAFMNGREDLVQLIMCKNWMVQGMC